LNFEKFKYVYTQVMRAITRWTVAQAKHQLATQALYQCDSVQKSVCFKRWRGASEALAET